MEKKLVPTEVYSRIVGYFRPVDQWNSGKKEEYRERINYNLQNVSARIEIHCLKK